jgi:hypothetical protein
MGGFGPWNSLVKDSLHSWEAGLQESGSLLDPHSTVLRVSERLVFIQLEETQFGVNFKHRSLPIGLDILIDFGHAGDDATTDGAQADLDPREAIAQ